MTSDHPQGDDSATRRHALDVARVAFVVATLGFAWWGFDGRWGEIGEAVVATGVARIAAAVITVGAGLVLTGALWRSLLASLGSPVGARQAGAVFFVGQLGKYVPGSVWSFAAQAQLGRKHAVPVRSSVAASALFLVVHTFTGVVFGALLAALGAVDTSIAPVWWALVALAGLVALSPPIVRALGDRLAGNGVGTRFDLPALLRALVLMTAVWLCYGAAMWLLIPDARADAADLLTAIGAFALAHVAGVLLILAPAGLGAREAVLIALLSPAIGVPAAAAAALLARVVHAIADFLLAAVAAGWARAARVREVVGVGDA